MHLAKQTGKLKNPAGVRGLAALGVFGSVMRLGFDRRDCARHDQHRDFLCRVPPRQSCAAVAC